MAANAFANSIQHFGSAPVFLTLYLYYLSNVFEAFVNFATEYSMRLIIETMRTQAGLRRKEIQLADGLNYVYLEGGRGKPLILLHGFDADKDLFTPISLFLTSRYRVIIPDHIGFGESASPADADYSPPAQAARLRAFVQAVGSSDLHLGGSSMGGQIALTYAALYPQQVKSLWLFAPSGVSSVPASVCDEIWKSTGENPLLIQKEDDALRVIRMVMSYPPLFVPHPILKVIAEQHSPKYALERRIAYELANDAVNERVAGLNTPALIVWGSKDRLFRVEAARILSDLMPRSQVLIMEHIGHLPLVERPLSSALDYLRFRASLER